MATEDLVFNLVSFLPGPVWLALWLAPRHQWTSRAFVALVVVLAGLYAFLILPKIPDLTPVIANPRLDNIMAMLATRPAIAAAWSHFVIGDIWIGRWIALDSSTLGLSKIARLPILILTLFFGPLGLLAYLAIRLTKTRSHPFQSAAF